MYTHHVLTPCNKFSAPLVCLCVCLFLLLLLILFFKFSNISQHFWHAVAAAANRLCKNSIVYFSSFLERALSLNNFFFSILFAFVCRYRYFFNANEFMQQKKKRSDTQADKQSIEAINSVDYCDARPSNNNIIYKSQIKFVQLEIAFEARQIRNSIDSKRKFLG